MKSPESHATWWPEARLNARPIHKVQISGHRLRPPALSHIVSFPRLEVPLSGFYENQIESEDHMVTVKLRPGMALFAGPNCWNLPLWTQNVELLSLLFGARHIGVSLVKVRALKSPQFESKKFSLPRPVTGPLSHLVDAMVEVQTTQDVEKILPLLAQTLVQCVGNLLQNPNPNSEGDRAQTLFESICIFLQNNYQYDISRETVAGQFSVSPTHLSRIFHTRGHMTFSAYLTHVRIDRAKHLLHSYNFKLDEIAGRCGYNHTTHFCEMFKRITKMTPSEYRMKTLAARAKSPSK